MLVNLRLHPSNVSAIIILYVTIVALKFYDVKGFGFAEVEQLYGIETMRNAAEHLRNLYEGKGKMRLKLFISVKGVRLYDHATLVSIVIIATIMVNIHVHVQ